MDKPGPETYTLEKFWKPHFPLVCMCEALIKLSSTEINSSTIRLYPVRDSISQLRLRGSSSKTERDSFKEVSGELQFDFSSTFQSNMASYSV